MPTEPFLAEISIVSFNFPPKGWALANGQLLPINQNQALFSLMGTMFGGNGQTNFALPNMRGRVPVHVGGGLSWADSGGANFHTLNSAEALHHHPVTVSGAEGSVMQPGPGVMPGRSARTDVYGSGPLASMGGTVTAATGGGQVHENRQPYLTLNYIIALQGVFPSRD